MSEKNLLKNYKIQDSGEKIGVQTLATRPNQPSVYGVGGLSADGLKKRFDRLADSIISKYNELCETLGGADALKHIQWKEENGDIKTLADFFNYLFGGNFTLQAGLVSASEVSASEVTASELVCTGTAMVDGSLTVWDNLGIDKSTFYNLEAKKLGVTESATIDCDLVVHGNLTAPNVVVTNPENGKTQSIDGILQLLRQLWVSEYTDLKGNVDVRKNLTVYGNTNLQNTSMINASAVSMDVETSLTARRLSTEEDATIGGNLFVKGTTYTVDQQSVVAMDNIIVTNAFASEAGVVDFLLSGLVIDTGNGAYGILYKPSEDAVVIGKGTLRKTTDSEGKTDVEFTFDEGQAIPLAARDGSFRDSEIPMWDTSKNAFVSSGKTVGNIVEETLGNVDIALDHILAIQNKLIGGTT